MDDEGDGLETIDERRRFEASSAYVSSLPADSLGNAERLRLYGLFKIATLGQPPRGSKPLAFWDIQGSLKYTAWKDMWEELSSRRTSSPSTDPSAFSRNLSRSAVQEYINHARRLGWTDDQCQVEADRKAQESSEKPLSGASTDSLSKPDQGSRDTANQQIERDEYGLEVIHDSLTKPLNQPKHQETSHSSTGDLKMRSVSKILPTSPPLIDSDDPLKTGRDHVTLGPLHDLVLDKDLGDLEAYLAHLHQEHLDNLDEFIRTVNSYHNGYTPFHLACDRGDVGKVNCLLRFHADPELKDQADQLTGLELANEAGMIEVVRFLSTRLNQDLGSEAN